ncbi:MAG: hypothetical protein WC204_06490 [Elusimicrobiales bacterium]|jgi:hypothetical protein
MKKIIVAVLMLGVAGGAYADGAADLKKAAGDARSALLSKVPSVVRVVRALEFENFDSMAFPNSEDATAAMKGTISGMEKAELPVEGSKVFENPDECTVLYLTRMGNWRREVYKTCSIAAHHLSEYTTAGENQKGEVFKSHPYVSYSVNYVHDSGTCVQSVTRLYSDNATAQTGIKQLAAIIAKTGAKVFATQVPQNYFGVSVRKGGEIQVVSAGLLKSQAEQFKNELISLGVSAKDVVIGTNREGAASVYYTQKRRFGEICR